MDVSRPGESSRDSSAAAWVGRVPALGHVERAGVRESDMRAQPRGFFISEDPYSALIER